MSRSIPTPILLATLALALAGCGSSTPATTAPDVVRSTETFTGTLSAHSSMWHPFAVAQTGQLEVKLTEANPAVSIGLGVGQVTTGCTLLAYNSAATVGTAISGSIQVGSYCVSVYDVGTLTDPVNYTVTVTHP